MVKNGKKNCRARWPRHLLVPSVEQFAHGFWVDHKCDPDANGMDHGQCERLKAAADIVGGMESGKVSKKDIEDLRYSCGTQCCIVGWAALAMGETGCDPYSLKNPATAKFLNKFIELAGESPTDPEFYPDQNAFIERTAIRASNLFEGSRTGPVWPSADDDISRDRSQLSPEEAHRLWKRTAEHFGYDTENLLD